MIFEGTKSCVNTFQGRISYESVFVLSQNREGVPVNGAPR